MAKNIRIDCSKFGKLKSLYQVIKGYFYLSALIFRLIVTEKIA